MPVRTALRTLVLLAVAVLALVPATRAQIGSPAANQIGLYVSPTFTRVSNSTPDPGLYAFLGQNQTSRLFSGASLGFFDQFAHTPLVDAGIDMRGAIQKGANAHLNQFLIGARASFHPAAIPLRPYIEVLGGVGGSRAATNPIYRSKGEYGGFAGLEYPLGKHVDFRVIEVGYTSLQTISTNEVTGTGATSTSPLLNFSTGIVFRFSPHLIP